MSTPERPLPQFPGGPDPSQPVPRDAVHGFDLAGYARLSARLSANPQQRRSVLSAHQLDEWRWIDVEKTWLLRLATAALQKDLTLLEEHDRAFLEAKRAIANEEAPFHAG